MKHWTYTEARLAPIGRPFVSREMAERFAAYWPGHLGRPTPVEVDPLNPPIWNVSTRDAGLRITVWYENRSQDFNFTA